MDAEQRLRDYVIKKYGELKPMASIIKYTPKELNTSKCEMCTENIHMKKSFVYQPLMKKLTGGRDLTICEKESMVVRIDISGRIYWRT
mgnify:CR=1 FL=1